MKKIEFKQETKDHIQGGWIKLDTIPTTPKGKDKLIENVARLTGITIVALTFNNLTGPAQVLVFLTAFIAAGIHQLKYYQTNKNLEVRFW